MWCQQWNVQGCGQYDNWHLSTWETTIHKLNIVNSFCSLYTISLYQHGYSQDVKLFIKRPKEPRQNSFILESVFFTSGFGGIRFFHIHKLVVLNL